MYYCHYEPILHSGIFLMSATKGKCDSRRRACDAAHQTPVSSARSPPRAINRDVLPTTNAHAHGACSSRPPDAPPNGCSACAKHAVRGQERFHAIAHRGGRQTHAREGLAWHLPTGLKAANRYRSPATFFLSLSPNFSPFCTKLKQR